MTCSAVSLLVPFSMENKAPKEECQLSFDRPPLYLALLDRIEQEPTALKLEQVKFQIKAGKEFVHQDSWTRVVGDRHAIELVVSVMLRSIAFSNLLFCPLQDVLLQSASSLFDCYLLRNDM